MTFELFARYSFPSDPGETFASIIFQKLPQLGDTNDPVRLLVDFCELVLEIWSRCLQEEYYQPVYDLVSLLSFVLQLNTMMVAPHIVPNLLPIAQQTIYLVGVDAFNSPDGDLSKHPDGTVQQLSLDIDTVGTLSVMYLTALGCLRPFPDQHSSLLPSEIPLLPQAQFWRKMQLEFVLMMLSPKQPRDAFIAMLSLLRTSILQESIGPVTDDPTKDPTFVSRLLIDRISHALVDPKWGVQGSYRYWEVRLTVLGTLASFLRTSFGKLKLAESDVAIPRLATVLSAAVDALYEMDVPAELALPVGATATSEKSEVGNGEEDGAPNTTQDVEPATTAGEAEVWPVEEDSADKKPDVAPLLLTVISSATSLLHTLITDSLTSDVVNLPTKLAASHGGSQRFILPLARLSFADDDLVFEAGVDASTIELARELLELSVTPDEGDAVNMAFEP